MIAQPNLKAIGGFRTVADFDREAEEFEARRQDRLLKERLLNAKINNLEKGGSTNKPAALTLANEYLAAKSAGDMDRANAIEAFAKTRDKNVMLTPEGSYIPQAGIADALAAIGAAQKSAERQAEKDVDEQMNPRIAGAEAEARLQQQLEYDPLIKERTDNAANRAKLDADENKKAVTARRQNEILDQAEEVLPNATGSGAGALLAAGKSFWGKSDASTQANKKLKLLSGWLVSNVPRMEGPQSDRDVINYHQMAANLGDETIPIEDRLAALQQLRELNAKYASSSNTLQQDEAGGINDNTPPLTRFQQEEAAFNQRKGKKKTIRFEDLPQ